MRSQSTAGGDTHGKKAHRLYIINTNLLGNLLAVLSARDKKPCFSLMPFEGAVLFMRGRTVEQREHRAEPSPARLHWRECGDQTAAPSSAPRAPRRPEDSRDLRPA